MNRVVVISILMVALYGCEQKETQTSQYQYPQQQYQFPTGPIQARDDAQLLRDALKDDPENLNALIKLGNIMMDTARFDEAIEAYQKALDIDPANVDVRVDMGTCYRRSGRPDRAAEEYRKGLEYNQKHLFGHRNLAIVLAYDLGETAEAIREFEKYLELAPYASDAEQIRENIQQLKTMKTQ